MWTKSQQLILDVCLRAHMHAHMYNIMYSNFTSLFVHWGFVLDPATWPSVHGSRGMGQEPWARGIH